eukprot:m.207002 g.207002  ORF g.207002 m.207002 type:complete len:232 (-) comp15538_c0_seq2:33-728(-)
MHRLRAWCFYSDSETILLSQLGITLPSGDDPVLELPPPPRCFDISTLGRRVAGKWLDKHVTDCRQKPPGSSFAFLNGKNAQGADSFVVFQNFVLLLQEKQSTTLRIKLLKSWASSRPGVARARGVDFSTDIDKEYTKAYAKASSLNEHNSAFVYVTDQTMNSPPWATPLRPNSCYIDLPQHNKFFSPTIAILRALSVSEEIVRAENEAYARLFNQGVSPHHTLLKGALGPL